MRNQLADDLYHGALGFDDLKLLMGIEIGPIVDLYFSLFGINVRTKRHTVWKRVKYTEHFSVLESLVKKYDLKSKFKKNKLTIFAPTNSVFYDMDNTLNELSTETIENVLLSHIVDKKLKYKDLKNGKKIKNAWVIGAYC